MLCRVDVAEAHYGQIVVLSLSAILGTSFWSTSFPGLGLELKVSYYIPVIFKSVIVGACVGCCYMWDSGMYYQQPPACPLYSGHQRSRQKWLNCGSKKLPLYSLPPLFPHWASSFPFQDTSVLSPIISPIVIAATLSYHLLYGHSGLIHTHYLLFFSAFGLQITKAALLMMVSTGVCGWHSTERERQRGQAREGGREEGV